MRNKVDLFLNYQSQYNIIFCLICSLNLTELIIINFYSTAGIPNSSSVHNEESGYGNSPCVENEHGIK